VSEQLGSGLLSESDIGRVVHAFYIEVQKDEMLAPIFATRISADDWESHMEHIASFWSSIFLKTGRFTGNPMQKHAALEGITHAHFQRWLALFREVSDKVLDPAQASAMQTMAKRIAQSLQMGLAVNYERAGQHDHPFTEFALGLPR